MNPSFAPSKEPGFLDLQLLATTNSTATPNPLEKQVFFFLKRNLEFWEALECQSGSTTFQCLARRQARKGLSQGDWALRGRKYRNGPWLSMFCTPVDNLVGCQSIFHWRTLGGHFGGPRVNQLGVLSILLEKNLSQLVSYEFSLAPQAVKST